MGVKATSSSPWLGVVVVLAIDLVLFFAFDWITARTLLLMTIVHIPLFIWLFRSSGREKGRYDYLE